MNIDYFIPDEDNETGGFSEDAMARLRKDCHDFVVLCRNERKAFGALENFLTFQKLRE